MAHHHEHHHCESCSHEHHHHEEGGQNHHHEHHHEEGGLKRQLLLIAVTAVLLVAAVLIEKHCTLATWQQLLVFLVPYLLIGHETLEEAWEGVTHGDMFNEHFLMSVATIGALCIGFLPGAETQFPEAVFVMLFFQVGELFEGYAEGKSRQSIAHLMDIRPDVVHVASPCPEAPLSSPQRGEEDSASPFSPPLGESEGASPFSPPLGESEGASPFSPPLGESEGASPFSPPLGELEGVSPEEVPVGSVIIIRPGEKVPLDGVVIEGSSALNTVALTGETVPREVTVGDEVQSGCVNLSGVVWVRTTKVYGESTVAKIINLVEHAAEHKSQSEAFITRFARVYTPIVVFAAVAIAIIPPYFSLLISHSSLSEAFPTWLYRALMFLVVSCPCALVISVPLTFFGGIGGASRRGILVKGANYMDVLAKVDTVVFDKTGTLTHGQFSVTAAHESEESLNEELRMKNEEFATAIPSTDGTAAENSQFSVLNSQLLHLAAHVEHFSTHPIGAALRDAFPDEATDGCRVSDVEEIAGQGIRARVGDRVIYVGNTKMMNAIGVKWHDCHHVGTIIHVAAENEKSEGLAYLGHIVINDKVKEDSAEAISRLKELGVKKTVMLTGDRREVAAQVAQQLGIDEYHAELLPADKVKFIEENRKSVNRKLAFVGDGINDAPVLARADVGIAMGGLGSDAAIEAADVVLMDDRPTKIATAISIARRTIAIARQNVWFAIGVKVAVLLLALFGLATMWMAVFADVGVTVLAVLNAMRALRA